MIDKSSFLCHVLLSELCFPEESLTEYLYSQTSLLPLPLEKYVSYYLSSYVFSHRTFAFKYVIYFFFFNFYVYESFTYTCMQGPQRLEMGISPLDLYLWQLWATVCLLEVGPESSAKQRVLSQNLHSVTSSFPSRITVWFLRQVLAPSWLITHCDFVTQDGFKLIIMLPQPPKH